ncbi:hypothetical protein GW17_00033658 [Ensete ventricosum]|nr:hypothetical protein GW17_00033658 [Ensete ventricosum]
MVTDDNNRYLAIPPGSERSAYWSAGGPVCTARYEALPPGKINLEKNHPNMISRRSDHKDDYSEFCLKPQSDNVGMPQTSGTSQGNTIMKNS